MNSRELRFQELEGKIPLHGHCIDHDHLDHEVAFQASESLGHEHDSIDRHLENQGHSKERVFTFKVIHKNALTEKNWGKRIYPEEINESIFKGLQVAYGHKSGINFVQKDSGYADFVFHIQNDRNTAAGYHRGDQNIVLEARDNDRGWSDHKIRVIAAHEVGHSRKFWGGGHDSSLWYDENGTHKHHLMHPWVNRLSPTYTSPKEAAFLVRRYGPDLEVPHMVEELNAKLVENGRLIRPVRADLESLRDLRGELQAEMRDNTAKLRDLNDELKLTRDREARGSLIAAKNELLERREFIKIWLPQTHLQIKEYLVEVRELRAIRLSILSELEELL